MRHKTDQPAGVRHLEADLADADAVRPALKGATALFLPVPGGGEGVDPQALLNAATSAGPAPITPQEQADAIGAALGESVRFTALTRDAAATAMRAFMPSAVAEGTLDILGQPTTAEQRSVRTDKDCSAMNHEPFRMGHRERRSIPLTHHGVDYLPNTLSESAELGILHGNEEVDSHSACRRRIGGTHEHFGQRVFTREQGG